MTFPYLTIGSCLKDEESYIEDFIKYHRFVGVERFVFFDRNFEKLNDLVGKEPDVEIIYFPDIPGNIHQVAWGNLIKYNQGKTKWLALIDADQVLVPVKTTDIREILKDYEDYASVQCNWHTFGSAFKEKRDPGSVYERFLLRAKKNEVLNTHTQFICQPDRTLAIPTEEPHYPLLPDGEISVNTNKEEISTDKVVALNPNRPRIFNVPPLHDILWVAHYSNKSKEEWMQKNAKGRADIYGAKMPMEMFDHYDSVCNEEFEYRVRNLWIMANK